MKIKGEYDRNCGKVKILRFISFEIKHRVLYYFSFGK